VIAAVDRIRIAIEQCQQAGDDGSDPFAQRCGVLELVGRRCCERAHD
jgi:hypothetical protein